MFITVLETLYKASRIGVLCCEYPYIISQTLRVGLNFGVEFLIIIL